MATAFAFMWPPTKANEESHTTLDLISPVGLVCGGTSAGRSTQHAVYAYAFTYILEGVNLQRVRECVHLCRFLCFCSGTHRVVDEYRCAHTPTAQIASVEISVTAV